MINYVLRPCKTSVGLDCVVIDPSPRPDSSLSSLSSLLFSSLLFSSLSLSLALSLVPGGCVGWLSFIHSSQGKQSEREWAELQARWNRPINTLYPREWEREQKKPITSTLIHSYSSFVCRRKVRHIIIIIIIACFSFSFSVCKQRSKGVYVCVSAGRANCSKGKWMRDNRPLPVRPNRLPAHTHTHTHTLGESNE
ncbi:MAG: hypothetical protein JOS17DRAFT_120376 [Linnemannia elongata]|nr:MAG: hypothetical protein JOS17DRAFT_120376 [Linnemannia elongata]